MNDIANSLKREIDRRGIKLVCVSKNTGIPTKLLSKTLLGKRKLLASEMVNICAFLNINVNDLLDTKNHSDKIPCPTNQNPPA